MAADHEILKSIEEAACNVDVSTIARKFRAIYETAVEKGDHESAQKALFEWEVFSLVEAPPALSDDVVRHLSPCITRANGSRWPDPDEFLDQQFTYYEKRLSLAQNPVFQLRYADFLFEYHKPRVKLSKYKLGKILCGILTDQANMLSRDSPESLYELARILARLVDVALTLNNRGMLAESLDYLFEVLQGLSDEGLWRVHELSKILKGVSDSPMRNTLSNERCSVLADKIRKAKDHVYALKYFEWYRTFCGELIFWGGFLKWEEDAIRSLHMEIGESWEREDADFDTTRGSKRLEADSLEKASAHYRTIGAREKADDLMIRIRQKYACSRPKLQEFSFSFEVSMYAQAQLLERYKGLIVLCIDLRAEQNWRREHFCPKERDTGLSI